MFTNLASYIFGSSSTDEANVDDLTTGPIVKRTDDDWVVVGSEVNPSLTLGSLTEVMPRPATGSTGSSLVDDDDNTTDEDMVVIESEGDRPRQLTRSARRLANPLACASGLVSTQLKALKASQKSKQKDSAKTTTAKATNRHNMAVKIRNNNQHNKRNKAANLAMRSSGCNKQLKQC